MKTYVAQIRNRQRGADAAAALLDASRAVVARGGAIGHGETFAYRKPDGARAFAASLHFALPDEATAKGIPADSVYPTSARL